jgi:ELWxxDGT repeat protein
MGAHRTALFFGTDADVEEGLWEQPVNPTSAAAELTGIVGAIGPHSTGLFDTFSGDGPDFVQFNGLELFQAVGTDNKPTIWTTDGTAAGTHELLPANAAPGGLFSAGISGQPGFTLLNNKVLFEGEDAAGHQSLWSTDGTAAGTAEVHVGFQPRYFTNLGQIVLFNDLGASFHETLWVTDGTSAGTHEITPISNVSAAGLVPQFLGSYNGLALFEGMDAAGHKGLWVSNGTAAGTSELTIANANGIFNNIGGVDGNPDFTTYNGVALFQGEDDSGNVGLWMTDGTGAGTHEIAPSTITGASLQFDPDSFIVYQGKVYFAAENNTTDTGDGGNLWVTDGTAAGTTQIHAATENSHGFFSAGNARTNPSFTIVDGTLLFRGFDSNGVLGTWAFNGSGSPVEINTVNEGSQSVIPSPDLVTFRAPTANDYFGDSTSDLALAGPGGLIGWDVQSGTFSRVSTIGNPGGFSAVHGIDPIHEALAGDFNGDGTGDILLRDGSGNLVDWTMHNGVLMGGGFIGNPTTFGYSVVGTGDFNGDGVSDILIQDGSGNLADWIVKSGVGSSANVIGNPAAFGYHAVATGDFNGDGTTDVLLENSSGTLAEWVMQNGAAVSANVIGNPTAFGFSLIGTGDFNGDGTTDLLLGNSNGTIGDWMMQNGQAVSANIIGNPASFGYNVVGTGDYNGDGTTDILIQNAAGNIADWTIKNGVGAGAATIGNPVPFGFNLA